MYVIFKRRHTYMYKDCKKEIGMKQKKGNERVGEFSFSDKDGHTDISFSFTDPICASDFTMTNISHALEQCIMSSRLPDLYCKPARRERKPERVKRSSVDRAACEESLTKLPDIYKRNFERKFRYETPIELFILVCINPYTLVSM